MQAEHLPRGERMSDRTVAIVLEGQGDKRSEGLAIVRVLDDRQRLSRALRQAGIAAGIAVITIFIPIIHFIVPPLALLTSIVLLVRGLNQGALIQGGGGPCPQCQQRVELEEQPLHWPVDMNCPHCRRSLTVSPADGPQRGLRDTGTAEKVARSTGPH
jgi:hypothetical protein